ncbi:hypothetical protein XENOCAPTIV_009846, partial [Xenoophorus captivus]
VFSCEVGESETSQSVHWKRGPIPQMVNPQKQANKVHTKCFSSSWPPYWANQHGVCFFLLDFGKLFHNFSVRYWFQWDVFCVLCQPVYGVSDRTKMIHIFQMSELQPEATARSDRHIRHLLHHSRVMEKNKTLKAFNAC